MSLLAAATDATSPWWGIPAFTLAGGVGGAAITQALTGIGEARKTKRDVALQGDRARREACTGLLVEMNKCLINLSGTGSRGDDTAMYEQWAKVEVSSSLDVVDAGRNYTAAWEQLVDAHLDESGVADALDRYHSNRIAFINVLRNEASLPNLR